MFEYHHRMLSDQVRMRAFSRAIAETVRPGDSVIDLGCGTGILAFLARRAGAAQVTAVELEPIIHLAESTAAQNGLDGLTFLRGEATSLRLPRADVIIGELVGILGIEEGIANIFHHVSRRCLKRDGRMLPYRLDVVGAPWFAPEAVEHLTYWRGAPFNLDFKLFHDFERQQWQLAELKPEGCLAEPEDLWRLDLGDEPPDWKTEVQWRVMREGELSGLGIWFRADLSPGVQLCTSPFSEVTHWQQGLLPITGIHCKPDDEVFCKIEASVGVTAHEFEITWEGEVRSGSKVTAFSGDTRHRRILAVLAALKSLKMRRLPPLTARGRALLSALEHVRDRSSLQKASRDLSARYPELYESRQAAMAELLVVAREWAEPQGALRQPKTTAPSSASSPREEARPRSRAEEEPPFSER